MSARLIPRLWNVTRHWQNSPGATLRAMGQQPCKILCGGQVYTDRSALFDVLHTKMVIPSANVALNHTIVMNGQIVGNWKRVFKKEAVVISPYHFTAFTDAEYHAFIT